MEDLTVLANLFTVSRETGSHTRTQVERGTCVSTVQYTPLHTHPSSTPTPPPPTHLMVYLPPAQSRDDKCQSVVERTESLFSVFSPSSPSV